MDSVANSWLLPSKVTMFSGSTEGSYPGVGTGRNLTTSSTTKKARNVTGNTIGKRS
jgi:hypothetical protein